jgi:transglutaminase-like putative cysteine protease
VILDIHHRTAFHFEQPVSLEPHIVRLRPRPDASAWPRTVEIAIDPTPSVRTDYLDAEGNLVTQAWFLGPTDHLTIEARSRVETLAVDPFGYLLDDPRRTLPAPYSSDLCERLQRYRRPPADSPDAAALARSVAQIVEQRPERFPLALTLRMHDEIAIETRTDGDPYAPDATLAGRRGACRDLAVLFVACCRSQGLAARFVSGYAHVDGSTDHELHAWAEVYVEGGGWRGYDPTLGVALEDRHVAVAAAAAAGDAAPTSGTYRGTARAVLETAVSLSAV